MQSLVYQRLPRLQIDAAFSPSYAAIIMRPIIFIVVLLVFVSDNSAARAYWPEFRGPHSNGYVTAEAGDDSDKLPTTWSESAAG